MPDRQQPETHQFVGSSMVDSAHYDPDTEQLTVTFNNGHQYTYPQIAPTEFAEFKASFSPGRWIHQNLGGRGS